MAKAPTVRRSTSECASWTRASLRIPPEGGGRADRRLTAARLTHPHPRLPGRRLPLRHLALARGTRGIREEGEDGEPPALRHRQCFVQQAAGEDDRPARLGLVELAAELGEAELAALVLARVQVQAHREAPVGRVGGGVVAVAAEEAARAGVVAADPERLEARCLEAVGPAHLGHEAGEQPVAYPREQRLVLQDDVAALLHHRLCGVRLGRARHHVLPLLAGLPVRQQRLAQRQLDHVRHDSAGAPVRRITGGVAAWMARAWAIASSKASPSTTGRHPPARIGDEQAGTGETGRLRAAAPRGQAGSEQRRRRPPVAASAPPGRRAPRPPQGRSPASRRPAAGPRRGHRRQPEDERVARDGLVLEVDTAARRVGQDKPGYRVAGASERAAPGGRGTVAVIAAAPSMRGALPGPVVGEQAEQALPRGRADAALGDQAGDQAGRRHVEGGVAGRAALGAIRTRRRRRRRGPAPDQRDLVGRRAPRSGSRAPVGDRPVDRRRRQRRRRTARRCRARRAP